MRRLSLWLCLGFLFAFPFYSPAPFIYTPGEGWRYEPVGGEGKWQQPRAKDQLEVAQAAFDKKAYGLALKAARRVVHVWPLSDYAPHAQYLVGRCLEAQGKEEKAFKEYQKLLEKNPRIDNYEDILKRQYLIADKYLAGKWFKVWGFIPFFPSMDRTAGMYEDVVRNGPYSHIAPDAQLKVGTAREKQHNFPLAVKAYEVAADRYLDRPQIAAEALYRAGLAYNKQAETAEYDQSTAGQAIATFTDFKTIYPEDPRVAEADKIISSLKTEQARGNFEIAKFYEKKKKWEAARTYYNEVVNLTLAEPNSTYGSEAKKRIDSLSQKVRTTPANPVPSATPAPANPAK
jgi:outer membrane protein assembly factor BamD